MPRDKRRVTESNVAENLKDIHTLHGIQNPHDTVVGEVTHNVVDGYMGDVQKHAKEARERKL
jgi:hypothetical protein